MTDQEPVTPTEPQPQPSAPTSGPPAQTPPHRAKVKRTRFSSAWVGAIVSAVLLVLLLIFIIQNSQKVKVSYLGFNGQISLGVALLLAAAAGVLLVAIPGTARIYQLRRTARRMAQDGTRARR